jgi:hypothetical protein
VYEENWHGGQHSANTINLAHIQECNGILEHSSRKDEGLGGDGMCY